MTTTTPPKFTSPTLQAIYEHCLAKAAARNETDIAATMAAENTAWINEIFENALKRSFAEIEHAANRARSHAAYGRRMRGIGCHYRAGNRPESSN